MKNEMIMKAFDSIHPESAADARMLGSIMAYQRTYRRTRVNVIRKYAAIAACLVLLLGAGIGVRYFGANRISVTLESGEMMVYHENDGVLSSDSIIAPEPLNSRMLTQEEIRTLFPSVWDAAGNADMYAYFSEKNGDMLHLEGRIGDLKICAVKEGLPVTDTVLTGNESVCTVCGIPVSAGYFVTKGRKTVIFYADYHADAVGVHAELAGDVHDSMQIGKAFSEALYSMIKSGMPQFSEVRYE